FMRACGIAAPPPVRIPLLFYDRSCGVCDRRLTQPLQTRSPPASRYDLLLHRRHVCNVRRTRRALLPRRESRHSRCACSTQRPLIRITIHLLSS
ncbi:MAG: hypothetical protein ACREX8_03715, partial [Gammaproteobacteria bacterium]